MTPDQFAEWDAENKKRAKESSEYDRKINTIKEGRIPWESGDTIVVATGTPEQAARVFVERYGQYGLTYEQALKEVLAYRKEKMDANIRSWGGAGMKF